MADLSTMVIQSTQTQQTKRDKLRRFTEIMQEDFTVEDARELAEVRRKSPLTFLAIMARLETAKNQ